MDDKLYAEQNLGNNEVEHMTDHMTKTDQTQQIHDTQQEYRETNMRGSGAHINCKTHLLVLRKGTSRVCHVCSLRDGRDCQSKALMCCRTTSGECMWVSLCPALLSKFNQQGPLSLGVSKSLSMNGKMQNTVQ